MESGTASHSSSSSDDSDYSKKMSKGAKLCITSATRDRTSNKLKSKYPVQRRQVTQHFGSFYLRMGAVGDYTACTVGL